MASFHQINQFPTLSSLLSKKSLVLGESGVGKTVFSAFFILNCLKHSIPLSDITIMDFAPCRKNYDGRSVGGKMQEYFAELENNAPEFSNEIIILNDFLDKKNAIIHGVQKPEIVAPRLSAKKDVDVLRNCLHNYKICTLEFQHFLTHPTPFLVINDVGIYLHLGGLRGLLTVISQSETVLLNAYYGEKIGQDYGSYVSRREKIIFDLLARRTNVVNTIFFNHVIPFDIIW